MAISDDQLYKILRDNEYLNASELKQAQTLDAKIGKKQIANRRENNGGSKWITGELARKEVHCLRNVYDAILIGANTVEIDNPELNVRGIEDSRNPIRIILDNNLITKPDANVYKNNATVFLVTKTGQPKDKLKSYKGTIIIEIPSDSQGKIHLKELFIELGKREILSVLVEAGPTLASELILKNLIDEYILFISPKIFGSSDGIPNFKLGSHENTNKTIDFQLFDYKIIGNDFMLSLRAGEKEEK